MQATLLLNASYEPLRVISWQKALTLFFAGKVEVVEEYDHEIHSIYVCDQAALDHPAAEVRPRQESQQGKVLACEHLRAR